MATENDVQMEPVSSSLLAALGYDKESQTLRAEFAKNGAVYEYDDVPESVYEAVLHASSVGEMFGELIKGGGYAYRRLS